VEDGYEFFAKRQLVTLFSAPNYCGEFDNAGGMMSVDETLMCSFQVSCFSPSDLSKTKTKLFSGVSDPHTPYADPDPDLHPGFYLNADPDSGLRILFQGLFCSKTKNLLKIKKKFEFFFHFLCL